MARAAGRRPGTVFGILRGVRYAFNGLIVVLTRPALWPYLIGPFLVTFVLFAIGAWGAWSFVGWAFDTAYAPSPDTGPWSAAWWRVAELLLRIWAIAIVAVGLYFASSILATPFNDALSQKVETLRLGPFSKPFSWATLFGDLSQSVVHSLLSLLLWATILVASTLLNVVPIFGTLAALVIDTVATALFISREAMDGCLSRRRMSFSHKLLVVRQLWPVFLGFGVVGSAVVWIPFVNLAVVPLSIAGCTMLYCDLEREGLIPNADGTPGYVPARARDADLADPGLAQR